MRNQSRLGDWYAFCDICGQRYFASEMTKLSEYTGKGGLIVCPNDVDEIDYGLVPYTIPTEKNIPWSRPNHTSQIDGAPIPDLETNTVDQISDFIYLTDESGTYYVLDDEETLIALSQDR